MVTDLQRRSLLKAALAGIVTPVLPFGCASLAASKPALIGCAITGREQFSAVVADEYGYPLHQLPLPARGHGVATNRAGHAAVFARRPGSFFMVFDYQSGEMRHLSLAAENRHYYGHGVYSLDGNYLFATEGERGTSRGIIGVYDVQHNYQKVDELSGFGIGPHEVIIMPDGTLVIGVGGVHTNGREPLNLASMQPSLSYLAQNGELLDQVTLADPKLSIRHLAHDGRDTVLCGQQYRGEPDEYPSLLAMHTRGGRWCRCTPSQSSGRGSTTILPVLPPRQIGFLPLHRRAIATVSGPNRVASWWSWGLCLTRPVWLCIKINFVSVQVLAQL